MDIDLLKFRTLKLRLEREGSLSLRVASSSMVPVLAIGETIEVKSVKMAELKKFDIIVFWQNDKIMCHFLWAIQRAEGEEQLITKSLEDPLEIDLPTKEGLLLGKVDVTIPIYLKIKMWLKNF